MIISRTHGADIDLLMDFMGRLFREGKASSREVSAIAVRRGSDAGEWEARLRKLSAAGGRAETSRRPAPG